MGLLKAVAAVVATAVGSALPVDSVLDAVIPAPSADDWRRRLVREIETWVVDNGDRFERGAHLPSGWEDALLEDFEKRNLGGLSPGRPEVQARLAEAFHQVVFPPLVDTAEARAEAHAAAEALVGAPPELVPHQATFARFTTSASARSAAWRFRQAG